MGCSFELRPICSKTPSLQKPTPARRSETASLLRYVLLSLLAVLPQLLLPHGCGTSGTTDTAPAVLPQEVPHSQEKDLERLTRARLGVPPQARLVAVFGMTSHWDINWLKTSHGYYKDSVEKIIAKALSLLEADPAYTYAISEIDFLKRFWDDHPEDRDRLSRHVSSGRLRIVGGGVTSPDTLLPPGELLVRDWLMGNHWSRTVLGVDPSTSWQPDSFGHAPSLPSILEAMGYRYVAFARTDGSPSRMPRPYPSPPTPQGTSAQVLEDARACDFNWVADDGSRILAHWMHDGYFVADGLDMTLPEASPVLAFLAVDPETTPFWQPDLGKALDRMAVHIEHLEAFRTTPYIFIPVGSDFAFPVSRLPEYIAGWNRARYEATGVYCVMAPFEDYIRMVAGHRDALPSLSLDMSPCWMGFYTSKPELKRLQRHTMEGLLAAEKLASLASCAYPADAGQPFPRDELSDAWYLAVRCNHHDGIPGTSTDSVYRHEQLYEMRRAGEAAHRLAGEALSSVAARVDTSGGRGKALVVFNPLSWHRSDWVEARVAISSPGVRSLRVSDMAGSEVPAQLLEGERRPDGSLSEARIGFVAQDVPPIGIKTFFLSEDTRPYPSFATSTRLERTAGGTILLENDYYRLVMDLSRGATLTSLVEKATGSEFLHGAAAGGDVVVWKDLGGLYRLGNEIHEGGLKEVFHTGSIPVTRYDVLEQGPLRVRVCAETAWSYPIRQEILLTEGLGRIEGRVTVRAPLETAFTLRYATNSRNGHLTMAVPYGEATRPEQKLYSPTFWPGIEWVSLNTTAGGPAFDMTVIGSRGWRFSSEGLLECMLHRNALIELPDILGPPGTDPDSHTITYALFPSSRGDWLTRAPWVQARAMNAPLMAALTDVHGGAIPPSLSIASVDDARAEIVAIKRPEDAEAEGLFVRIFRYGPEPITVRLTLGVPGDWEAWQALASETSLGPGLGASPSFEVSLERRITTVFIAPEGSRCSLGPRGPS